MKSYLNKEEEVIPTHNKKILIAKVIEYDFEKVSKSIEKVIEYCQAITEMKML